MTETIAANRIYYFKIPVSTKNLWERICRRDQAPLNIIYRGHIVDLYENANSFSVHTNFG